MSAKSRLAGFEGHLTKPVNFQKLEAAIWQLTSKSDFYTNGAGRLAPGTGKIFGHERRSALASLDR